MAKLAPRCGKLAQPADGYRREVRPAIGKTVWRQPFNQKTDAAANLQNPLRRQVSDALDRTIQPLAHLCFGNCLVCEITSPAHKRRSVVIGAATIGLIESLPPLDDPPIPVCVKDSRLRRLHPLGMWHHISDR